MQSERLREQYHLLGPSFPPLARTVALVDQACFPIATVCATFSSGPRLVWRR